MSRRTEVLLDLVNGSRPVSALMDDLKEFRWDSDQELVVLDRHQVVAILRKYLDGKLESSEVNAWAEAIEGRDDIGMSEDHQKELQEAIFRLSNPDLGYLLSPQFAKLLMSELSADPE